MYTDGVVTLAPFERDDLPAVLRWVNDVDLARLIERVVPVTSTEHAAWYETLVGRRDAVTFAIRADAELIGLCGLKDLHPRHRHAELWLYIGAAARRGQGLGRRATELLVRFGFEQLNLHRLHLWTLADNEAALRTWRACGFREEGRQREHVYRDGRYHDVVRMGLLRSEQRED